ncbi:MAG: hypothetical protein P8R54_22465 [Myxococcota bacterium]|nr:hypothetical protein [Myxococcota bacterium]
MARRLMIFDDTCRGQDGRAPLTWAWSAGGPLYRGLGRLDEAKGVTSWAEGLAWLAGQTAPIAEVQFWGHGRWGRAMVGGDILDAAALHPDHALNPMLRRIRDNLSGPEALWWWRTCETYGALAGQQFAERWSSFLGCRSAGHTHIIGVWQSGLRGIRPNQKAWWGPEEGLASGTPARPTQARLSSMRAPDTISFLSGTIPERCWR